MRDTIGPNLTLSKSADLSKDKVEVTITTDEQLGESPTVYVTRVTEDDGAAPVFMTDDQGVTSPVDGERAPVQQTAALTYIYEHADPGSGEFSVYVEGEDTGGHSSTAGSAESASHTSSFSFELDKTLNGGSAPEVTMGGKPAANGSGSPPDLEAIDPMIVTVEYSGEAGEYMGDSYRTVTLTSAELKVSFDDGASETTTFDLTTQVSTPDNVQFTIPLLNPKVGSYTLTVKATDSASNSGPTAGHSARWNVVAPKPVTIELEPGWNLISLPFQPANPAINSVIPAHHPAGIVMTYDNASQVWMVSRRDAETGRFTGDVTVMTASTAYFIRTDNFLGLKLLRPPLTTAAAAPPPPPAIAVVEGWNLVSIVSNDIPTPKAIPADDYFGTLGSKGWLKALTFNTLVRTWESVSPGETVPDGDDEDDERDPATVTVGKGYWLYATKAGVIIP